MEIGYSRKTHDLYSNEMAVMKIKWVRHNNTLCATTFNGDLYAEFLTEQVMDPIQEWCEKHNCGYRTSFDTFRFKNEQELSMFLMRWA